MTILAELKRRKVFQAIAAYAVFAWIIVEIAVTLEEPLSLPGWTDTLVIALLAAGFPVALFLSWVFDLTRDGPVRTAGKDVSTIQKSIALTAGLLFIVAFLIGTHRIATGVWIFEPQRVALQLSEQALVSTFSGSHTEPALSPDGTMVAFVSDDGGTPQLWVKNLREGRPVKLTNSDSPVYAPAWSPNNDEILFHTLDGSLWSVGPLGTPEPHKIVERGIYADFSRDGSRIVFEAGRRVFIADADGTNSREVTNIPERFFTNIYTRPALSPDGQSLAIFLQSTGPNGDYWIVPLDGGDPRQLTSDVSQGGAPAWTADGENILFASKRGGTQTLWTVPFEGGVPVPLTTGVGEDSDPAISLDGKTLVYSNARVEFTIMVSDPDTGESAEIYRSRNSIYLPHASPDGSQFVFFSETANGVHILTVDSNGNKVTPLTHGKSELNIHPIYSADGEHVYYYHQYPEQSLRKVPVAGGPSVEVFPDYTWQTHMRVVEDPSGSYLAMTRMEPPDWSKDRNLIVDLETGEERLVAEQHIHSPDWTSDGQWLLGSRHNGELAICPTDGGECEVIMHEGEPVLGTQPRWSSDESRVFFRRSTAVSSKFEVWAVSRDGSNAQRLLEYGPLQALNRPFEMTPDDKIVWVRYNRGDNELWTAEID